MKLDDIRNSANAKYADLPVEYGDNETLFLRNALQLDEATRNKLQEDGDEDTSTLERFRHLIRVVADDKDKAEHVIGLIGENLAFFSELVTEYNKTTQVGEA